ncbi:MAG: hypothetical protein EXR50_02865 [Dehalococcoidia bacterium]|nr:hypothetical protein [Dehalococcoidia bacterium]
MSNALRILSASIIIVVVSAAAGFAARGLLTPDAAAAPFSAIQAGEVVVVPDPGGTTATLSVASTIDAVCAVAYGETETLGRLATDQDMSSGPHHQHSAVMKGLKPGTTYFYRLQGVGVDGRLYRSPLFTVKSASAPAATSARNAAVGARVVEVSSEFSQSFTAKNAVDGDDGTEWSSRGDGDRAFITIDLGRATKITGVAFRTRAMSDGTATTRTFTVTVDGKDTYGPFPAGTQRRTAQTSFTGQVLRFSVAESTGGNTGAAEVEAYSRD